MELHNSNPKRKPDQDFDIWRLQRKWDNILVEDYHTKGIPVWVSKFQGTYVNPERNGRLNKKERREAKRASAQ